jgi:drug/metabolite transporter (DMT)-like permease
MLCGFSALGMMPFAEAIAISFTAPLFATAGAAIFLHEVVKMRRWTATIVGFIGVLIIVRPGAGALSLGVPVALAAAAFSSATSLMVKDLVRTEPTASVVTYMVLIMTPLSLLPALFVWTWPGIYDWPLILGMGLSGTLGHLAWTRAFSLADASAVMPYDYSRMLFGAVIGFVVFNEVPTIYTWIGAAIICASAIYIAKREALRRQDTAAAAQVAAAGAALARARSAEGVPRS